jgi:hypothetical protein
MGEIFAFGPCWACGDYFSFDPVTVDSVPIDPETNLPPDLGGDAERAYKRPVCPACMELVWASRAARGTDSWC